MIYVYEASATAEHDKQLLRDFQKKIPGSKMTDSEMYQKCDVAVIFGSWKKLSKKDYKQERAPHHILKNDVVINFVLYTFVYILVHSKNI